MTEQRLRVESGPPQHMIDDGGDAAPPSYDDSSKAESVKAGAQQAAAKAQEIGAPAAEKAREVAGQARDRASAQVDERTTQLGRQIGTQAESIDGVADELRRQGNDAPAKIAEQASERVKSVAGKLEQADGESLVNAAADAARENPALAAAAGAAAGFVAGRVIKAATGDDAPAGTSGAA